MARGLDTLAAAKRLSAAGMAPEQAEAVAAVVRDGQDDLVTRADLRAHAAELQSQIAGLERRLMLFAIALAGALFAALRFL